MKKINKYVLISTLTIISVLTFAFSNSISEGVITYTIDMSDIKDLNSDPNMAAMFENAKMLISFNDKFVKTEVDMGMVNVITIADLKNSVVTSLMDMMGNKIALELNNEEFEKQEALEKDLSIEYLDETKEIAGYKCNAAIIKSTADISTKVYYTKDIQLNGRKFVNGMNSKLPGAALEFEVSNQGMNIRFTATKIEQKKLSNDIFDIPSGYEKMTQDELMKMMKNPGQ